MASKYQPLTNYLQKQDRAEISMTFREIEKVIGTTLPRSKGHRAWWSNNPSNNVMTRAWLAAGYETEQVDLPLERLKFVKRRPIPSQPTPSPEGNRPAGRHPAWGSLKGTTIVMPGVDLTQPTAPEWGRFDDE